MQQTLDSLQVARMLKKRYTLALSIIAFLVIFSQILIQFAINAQRDDSRVINIAGRQRMLSQRINKAAFGLYITQSSSETKRYIDELKLVVPLWEKSHKGLQRGDKDLGLPGKNSKRITVMFAAIQHEHDLILSEAKEIISYINQTHINPTLLRSYLYTIQDHEQAFLKGMDAIVFQYDAESKQKIARVEWMELGILVVTLFTLLMEMLFIFRPSMELAKESITNLEISHQNLEKLFETAPAAMLLLDEVDLKIKKLNRLAKEMISSREGQQLPQNIQNLLEMRDDSHSLHELLKNNHVIENREAILKNLDNIRLDVLLSSNAIRYDDKDTIVMGLADISRVKEAEEVLRVFATIDEMTGLYNKRSGLLVLENIFTQQKKNNGDVSICFIDVDGLKEVNDNYGHLEGDIYIQTIAKAIFKTLPHDVAFRYGGDEIVVLFENQGPQQTFEKMEQVVMQIKQQSEDVQKPYSMHVSYGVASLSQSDTNTAEELLSIADLRMYENKQQYKSSIKS